MLYFKHYKRTAKRLYNEICYKTQSDLCCGVILFLAVNKFVVRLIYGQATIS